MLRNSCPNQFDHVVGPKPQIENCINTVSARPTQQIRARFLQSFQIIMFGLFQTLQVNRFMSAQSPRVRLCFGDRKSAFRP